MLADTDLGENNEPAAEDRRLLGCNGFKGLELARGMGENDTRVRPRPSFKNSGQIILGRRLREKKVAKYFYSFGSPPLQRPVLDKQKFLHVF
jgi:hypothetical protein